MTDTVKDGRKTATETLNESARTPAETLNQSARTTAETSARAAGEAMRAAAEASRRTVEGARAAADVTREYVDQSAEASRKLFDAWASGAEASLRAAFELQNTALATGLSFIKSNDATGQLVAQQWSDAAHEAQEATLEAWRVSVGSARKLATAADKAAQR